MPPAFLFATLDRRIDRTAGGEGVLQFVEGLPKFSPTVLSSAHFNDRGEKMRTERSFSSVVIPVSVRFKGFLENGASIMIGSKKYPIDRESGQSCTTGPPEMTPGLRRNAVPAGCYYSGVERTIRIISHL